jgi:tetratricopeptide (TPR) repeat protein/predicted Ser/Thr protein kinase
MSKGRERPDAGEADADPGESRMGRAPSVRGAADIRVGVRARLFGEDVAASPPADAQGPAGAAAPKIADRARIKGRVAAQLFGPSGGADSEPEAWGEDTEVAGDAPKRATEERIDEVVGRFRVLEPLGRGGMGVVYSAYDPELDRKVAIKLLRADVSAGLSSRDAQARLLREAQAMARLNHPNVIVVHEVGTVGDRVFVAMEFVDGGTLRAFMDERPPWRAVLEVFLRAGAGLAAAHAAGLVHRDFKPDNVLLGKDGRVRVVDFGLARSLLDPERDETREGARAQRPEVDSLHTPLTRTGAVMGTPAYMSPEQHLGHPADARSDQFSFCVALFEGLYGQRPFAGKDLVTLSTNVVRGELREGPGDVRLPKRVTAALRRGLSPRPSDRFASMEELLHELARDPARRFRWVGLASGVAVLASAITYAAFGRAPLGEGCARFGDDMAAVWNDDARADVQRVLMASQEPYAERVSTTTTELIDTYASKWIATAEEVCAARQVGSDDGGGARRQRCLEARKAEVEQLLDALRSGATGMTQQAVPAAADLSDLGACTDPRRLAAWDAPGDAITVARVAAARARIAAAKAQGAIGDYDDAIAVATDVIAALDGLAVPAVEASALLVRGQYRERAGKSADAESDLRLAVQHADAAGDWGTKAQALTRLVFVISRDLDRYDEAMQLGSEAKGVLDSLDAAPLLQADLDGVIGAAARNARHYDLALEHHARALETRERLLGESHPDTAASLANIGSTLSTARRLDEAEPYLRRAHKSLEAVLGNDHPWVGTALGNLANCLARQGRFADALPLQERALAIQERAFGTEHESVVRTTFNLGKLYTDLGRHAEARQLLEKGLAAKIAKLGPKDLELTDWYTALGENEEARGDLASARAYHERGLEVHIGDGSPSYRLAKYHFAIARCLVHDDPVRARQLLDEARAGFVVWSGRGSPAERAHGEKLREEVDAWKAAHLP